LSYLLGNRIQITWGVQVAVTPDEEEGIILDPIEDMVSVVIEMMSRSLVISRAIRIKVQRNFVAATEKLKAKLAESSTSLLK